MSIAKLLKKAYRLAIPKVETTKIVSKHIDEGVAEEDINKLLVKDREFLKGELAVKNAEIKRLKKEFNKNIVKEKEQSEDASQQEFKELARQNTTLAKKRFIGSLSLSKLYQKTKKGDKLLKDTVKVLSYDHQKTFGTLQDILFLKDGSFSIVVKNHNGKNIPIIAGNCPSDLFTNYQALPKEVTLRTLAVNITSEGEPHIDPFAEEVPRTVITATGKVARTSYDTERAMNLIDEQTAKILEQSEKIRRLESALSEQSIKIKTLNQAKNLMEESSEEASAMLIAAMKETNQNSKAFYELNKQAHMNDFTKQIEEERNEQLEATKDKIMKSLGDKLGASNAELAQEDLQRLVEWIFNQWGQPQQEAMQQMKNRLQEQERMLADSRKQKN